MEKAESLSFPTVQGSGGRGQRLHNEKLVGAKRLNCHSPTFLLSFVIRFLILIPTPSYHTLHRFSALLCIDSTNPTQNHSETMADAMEIKGMPALPPIQCVVPVVHASGKGDGQNWPLVSTGMAVAAAATLQPRQRIFRVTMRGSWTSPLNRRGR